MQYVYFGEGICGVQWGLRHSPQGISLSKYIPQGIWGVFENFCLRSKVTVTQKWGSRMHYLLPQ